MAMQATGKNVQQIGDRSLDPTLQRANILNVADVADKFASLSLDLDSQKAN